MLSVVCAVMGARVYANGSYLTLHMCFVTFLGLTVEHLERLDHFRRIIESGTISEKRSSISLEREGSISDNMKRLSMADGDSTSNEEGDDSPDMFAVDVEEVCV